MPDNQQIPQPPQTPENPGGTPPLPQLPATPPIPQPTAPLPPQPVTPLQPQTPAQPQPVVPIQPQTPVPQQAPAQPQPIAPIQPQASAPLPPQPVAPLQPLPAPLPLPTQSTPLPTQSTLSEPTIPQEHPKIAVTENEAVPKSGDGKVDIIKLIDNVFTSAKRNRSSDIHIEPTEKDVFVRFRVDGEFHEYYHFSLDLKQEIITRAMVIAGLKIDEMRLPQDGKIVTNIDGKELDMRVSTFPAMYGNKIVFRLLEKESSAKTLEDLGYSGLPLETIMQNLTRTYGMILMTGPTGSGKSTTLFSMLSSYDPFKFNISTLEDPVEYVIPGANQAQVNADIGFDFPDGLRCLVRQDPDIIMIGEIRDKVTANLSVQAALTGHLVFSTLHANSASATIQRLSNMEVDPFLAASALNVIISQRLVRKNCEKCKTAYAPPSDQIKSIQDQMVIFPQLQNIQFFKGLGCEECGGTGYKGRLAIYEVLPITSNIQKAIIENPIAEYIERVALQESMLTIEQNGLFAVAQGNTTLEEVLVAVDIARKTS